MTAPFDLAQGARAWWRRFQTPPWAAVVAPREPAEAWVRYALAVETLGRVLAKLDAAGIEALPVKGIVTAVDLYAHPSERPFTDIDLRVRPRDFEGVLAVARREGWAREFGSPQRGAVGLHVPGFSVEVETSVGMPGLCGIDVDELLRTARRRTEPFGYTHFVPELHRHALLLALNVFKDYLLPLPWAREDLVRVARLRGFDDGELVALARRGGVTTILWLVSDWLASDGDARWAEVRARIGRCPRPVYARAFSLLRDKTFASSLKLLVHQAAADPPRRRARAVRDTGVATLAWWHRRRRRGILEGDLP